MGLDMFAFKVKTGSITTPVDFSIPEELKPEQLHYWRKHPNLHGLMEKIYEKKGGSEIHNFNCVNVQLNKDDLNELEKVIQKGKLVPTSGFFFGQSDGSEKDDDLQFIKDARQAIEDGYDVYYTSWW